MKPCKRCRCALDNHAKVCASCGWVEPGPEADRQGSAKRVVPPSERNWVDFFFFVACGGLAGGALGYFLSGLDAWVGLGCAGLGSVVVLSILLSGVELEV